MTDQTSAACHTEPVLPPVHHPEPTSSAARGFDWFAAAALATWVACGLWPLASLASGRFSGRPALAFVLMFALYGAAVIAVLALPRRQRQIDRRVPIGLALAQSVTGIAMNAVTAIYLSGTGMGLGLLVIVAAELPYFLGQRQTWGWILVQTIALVPLVSIPADIGILETLTFALAAFGFQIFAATSSTLAISEGRARMNLARTNAELTATRELLAESSRTAERLRISRDLHDTLGHHLTALSLQLDVAARLSEGKATEHIRQAHAITRLLLSDVRSVVSTLRETSRLNVAEALRALAVQPIGARVHLDVPESLLVDDGERAEAILRAVQEALTNTARHARAANLWVRLERTTDGVVMNVRDDGRGAEHVSWGNGLRGMRERFEQCGGHVDVTASAGTGFEVRAFMPMPRST